MKLDGLRDPSAATDAPSPVADEVKLAAIEAVWDSQAWKTATWLGHPVNRYPADLHAYQELIATVRPRTLVLTGDDEGLWGRALFLASVCDQLDHGRIIAVGRTDVAQRPEHDRIVHVQGMPEDPLVAEAVVARAGADPHAVLFVGVGDAARVVAVVELYQGLVPAGHYVVVESTVVNGRPVAPEFGAGPYEGAVRVLEQHPDLVVDSSWERYTVTFNRNGFLRRIEQT